MGERGWRERVEREGGERGWREREGEVVEPAITMVGSDGGLADGGGADEKVRVVFESSSALGPWDTIESWGTLS